MRILFLSNFYPPHHYGGYEEVCAEVARRLRARAHVVTVLTSDVEIGTAAAPEPGVFRVLHPEVATRRFRGTLGFFFGRRRRLRGNLRSLAETLRRENPDVVVVWGMWNLHRELLHELERPGAPPLVYYVHDYWPLLPSAYALHWEDPGASALTSAAKSLLAVAARRALRAEPPLPPLRFAHLLCVSEAVRDALQRGGIPMGGASVLPAGIDTAPFRTGGRREKVSGSDFSVGYCGRLKPEKGISTAIEAVAELARRGHGVRLVIVGRGPLEGELRRRASELGVAARVDFRGFVERRDIPGLLRAFDAVVVPSSWPEPWARVIQEAMAAGAVVVASRVGGNPHLIGDGESGLLFEAGDSGDLADRIELLLRDPERHARIGARAAEVAHRRFEIAATVERLESVLATRSRVAVEEAG